MDTVDKTGAVLLVVRRVASQSDNPVAALIRDLGYRVEVVPRGVDPVPSIQSRGFFVACFDYDYLDLPGLADLQRSKREAPSTPILMITCGHSEAIAVWALRSRVWDYFVDPIDRDRFRAVLRALAELALRDPPPQTVQGAAPRRIVDVAQGFPREARFRPSTASPEPLPALDAVLSYIDRNLHNKILQADVAGISGLSPFQFSRAFKRYFEMTFQEYVLRRRIAEAMRLLRHPGASVSDVCYTVGFRDPSYFTRIFNRYVGRTPSAYRVTAGDLDSDSRSSPDTQWKQLLAVPPQQALYPMSE